MQPYRTTLFQITQTIRYHRNPLVTSHPWINAAENAMHSSQLRTRLWKTTGALWHPDPFALRTRFSSVSASEPKASHCI